MHKMSKLKKLCMCETKKNLLASLAEGFVLTNCEMTTFMAEQKKLCDGIDKVNGFCYLSDKLNTSGGSAAKVPARIQKTGRP